MNTVIPYTRPSITDLEIRYATDAVATGWGARCYDYLNRFEEEFRQAMGTAYAVATSSCTGALHMGLAALGIGPGDEVILADTNWIASAAPVRYVGADPVFVDILPDTWCLNTEAVRAAMSPRTKAVIAVHLYGNVCQMGDLMELGAEFDVPIVEDAAQAIGASWHGRHVGSVGRFGVFSFHGTKTLTTGEGGMLLTNDEDLYERVLTLSRHGRSRSNPEEFFPDMLGFKYRMSNVQAAIGCAQTQRLEELTARKREIFQRYHERLCKIPGISMNPEPQGTTSGYWMPTVVLSKELGITRRDLQNAFAARKIDARVFFAPLSSLSMFTSNPENVNAYDIPGRAMNLPSFHDMTDEQLDSVASVVCDLVKGGKKP